MEENIIQPTQKQSFKIPLIVLIVTFILNVILGYVSMANMTVVYSQKRKLHFSKTKCTHSMLL